MAGFHRAQQASRWVSGFTRPPLTTSGGTRRPPRQLPQLTTIGQKKNRDKERALEKKDKGRETRPLA